MVKKPEIEEIISEMNYGNKDAQKYRLFYEDRLYDALCVLEVQDILYIEERCVAIYSGDNIVMIPFHRIKKAEYDGEVIFQRRDGDYD